MAEMEPLIDTMAEQVANLMSDVAADAKLGKPAKAEVAAKLATAMASLASAKATFNLPDPSQFGGNDDKKREQDE